MRTLFINLSLIAITSLAATTAANSQHTLEGYLQEGLKNNQVLQQKNLSLDKALLSLKIAKGMFMPSINLQGAYTSGEGGRNIAIPVGDLLNPVYTALNQITESNAFPQIENVDQNFFPYNFYDVKMRTSMPLLNSDLLYNQKIKQQQVVLQEFEQDIYKRELVKNIKTAYYNYLSATEAIEIYRSALDRALEGRRVNESLLANGKGLPAYVLRAQSEVETTKAQLVSSEKQAHNAQLYFNFLLNRDSSAPIDKEENFELSVVTATLAENANSNQREELKQVNEAVSLNETILKMNKLYWSPKLSGFADFGSQAQNWEFNNHSRYYLFGVQLDVPLFAGFTNRNRVYHAELEVKNAELNHSLVSKQLDMSTQISKNGLMTAYLEFQAAQKQLEAAQSYQRLIDKGYAEGVNSFIETVDARTQLTAAQLQTNINRYRLLISLANFERETASYALTN